MSDDFKTALEIAALVIGGIVAIFVSGRWFGWKHKEILDKIATIKNMLEIHIIDETEVFNKIEQDICEQTKSIRDLQIICNGYAEHGHTEHGRPQ
jgi:hypothetical protein